MSPLDLLAAAGMSLCYAVALAAVWFIAWTLWPTPKPRRRPGTPPDYEHGRNRLAAELYNRQQHEIAQLEAAWKLPAAERRNP